MQPKTTKENTESLQKVKLWVLTCGAVNECWHCCCEECGYSSERQLEHQCHHSALPRALALPLRLPLPPLRPLLATTTTTTTTTIITTTTTTTTTFIMIVTISQYNQPSCA